MLEEGTTRQPGIIGLIGPNEPKRRFGNSFLFPYVFSDERFGNEVRKYIPHSMVSGSN
jgi:hypothetical protein